jgi:hypothetical protein
VGAKLQAASAGLAQIDGAVFGEFATVRQRAMICWMGSGKNGQKHWEVSVQGHRVFTLKSKNYRRDYPFAFVRHLKICQFLGQARYRAHEHRNLRSNEW